MTSVSFLGGRGRQQRLLIVRIWLFLKYCLAQHGFTLAQRQSEAMLVVEEVLLKFFFRQTWAGGMVLLPV